MTAKERLKQMAEEAQERINQRQKQTETEIAEIKSQESKLNAKEMLAQRAEQARKNIETRKQEVEKMNNYLVSQEKTANLPSYQEHLKVLYNNDYTRVLSDEEKKNTNLFDNSVYSKGDPKTQSILKLQNFAKQNGLELVNSPDSDANLRNLYNQSKKLDKDKQEELLKYLRTYYTVENEQLKNENYIGNRIMKGVISSVSGGIDATTGLISKAVTSSNQLINAALGNNEKSEDETEVAKDLLKYNILGTTAEQMARKQTKMEQVQNVGTIERFTGDVAEGISGMIPTVLISMYTQNPNLALTMMSTSAGGNAYRQAINEGASNNGALAYGTLMAIKEYTTEKMFGAANKLAGFDVKGYGDELAESIINRIFKENGNKILRGFTEFILGGVEEGLEEFFGDLVEPYIKNLTLGTKEKANLKEALYNGLVGGITGLAMSAPGTAIKLATDSKQATEKASMYPEIQKAIDNQIVDETKSRNIEYLKNKYGLNVSEDGKINDQPANAIDRLKQKYNLRNEEYNVQGTNLQTTPQNNTNFEKTSPNTVQLDEDNVQNALDFEKTVQNNSNIQGLEDYTEQDIKDLVSDYIQDLDTNVQIKGIAINGSRARGDSQVTSDLDVVVEYDGDMSEDALFNILNEEPLTIDGIQVDINPITASKSGTLEQYMKKSQEYDAQKYEESDVFENRASYDVDINKENEYNTEKREVARKPETRNYTYKKIESRDIARVNSDYMTNKVKYADDVGVVNFDDVSYAYEKTNDGINVLLKFKGSQNYIKGVTEYVRGSSNTRPKGYNRYVEIARSRYADNNISDADGGRTRTSEESNIETDRTRRQGRKDDIAENVKNNGNNLENSEEQGSFSMPEVPKNHIRLYRGLNEKYNANYDRSKLDNVNGYESWTDNYELAKQYGENVYYIDLPLNKIGDDIIDQDGERFLAYKNDKPVALNNIPGNEYMLYTYHDDFENIQYNETSQNSNLPETDNQGRKLTKEQQDYFKDSNVRDENGNLVTVYHGTGEDFTVFTDKFMGKNNGNAFGQGYYFTSSKYIASFYKEHAKGSNKRVMQVYLNIKNPFDFFGKGSLLDKAEYLMNKYDVPSLEKNSIGYNPRLDYVESKLELNLHALDFIKSMASKNNVSTSEILQELGYDGIIAGNEFVVFNSNQIKSVDNTNPTDNPDILKEPRAEYEAQMKLNMDITTEAIESAKNYNGGLKPIVIGHRIWEGYKKQGYIDLNNTKVSTAQDMAEIAQIFRNPYYETFRVIYTKGKGRDRVIVGQEALTSFLPSSVNLINKENTLAKYTYKMKNRMKRLEADGYYLLHNHPSGNAKASKADIKLTETIANLVPGFNDHIIVDHGTYAYIYITQPGLVSGGEGVAVDDIPISTVDSSYDAGVYTEEKLNEYLDKTISNRTEIVKLASNFRHDKDYSTLILADSGLKLNAVIDVPNSIFDNHKQIENYIRNISKKYGATNAFIATQNDDTYRNLIKNVQNVRDIILYRANGEGFVKATQGAEVFLREAVQREKRSLGIGEETKEERIERVRKYVEETQKSIGTLGANVSRKDIVTRIIDNYGITTKGNSKELNRVSKEIQELIKKGGFTDNKIEGYAEQLIENLKVTIDDYYNANKELKELIRRTKLYASDSVKAGFADWADFRKSNVGTIRATNDVDALPVDTFYQELSEMYGETFFPSDIINPSDQLEKIAEVAKQIKVIDMTLKQNLEENFGEEARNEIVNGLIENFKTLREQMTEEVSQNDVVETPEIKTRRWSQTVRKNDMVQTFLDKDLQDYKYVVRSNKATIAKANETLMRKGYDESIHYFDSVVESGKFPTVDDIALGERLIQESIKRGEFEKATEIIADVTILGTELGQAVQAMSMISRLSPAGQLMYLERAVKRINEKQQTKRKKPSKKKKTGLDKVMDEGKVGDIDIKITDEMKKDILSAKTPEELEVAVTRVKEQIAAQLPVEMAEKLSEWRYLAMLGNPKTHIRNTVGNLVMVAPYEMKNLYQRIIETTFNSKLEERTKTFKKSTEVVKLFVEDMVEQNKDTLTGNGYTNIQSELKNMRKIYKTKVLETLKKANMKALDFEDFVFKKRAFKSTLAEYLTANGIKTEKDIQENPELIQKGINYAIEEAKKATFNQYNSVATAISRFESDKTIGKIIVGGLAPFKRTPLNIVKTAWQYSPAGLAETLTLRTMDLKNGLITANDYIERISQGLTGVSITAIGLLLASMGVLTGSMGSKKKDKYEQSIGLRVPYSIKAGDRYVDISWLSPSAIPLLIGAELYSLADDGESGLSIDGIIKVLEKMMNPISEMTMLSTFNDALINYAGEDNEISGLAGILDTVVKSYIGQAFPTLGSQINKIIDPTVRTTKVSKNSKFKTGEQIVRTNMNKFIGLSYLLEPSTDIWGNIQKRSDNVVLRSIDSLFNPASVVENKSTSVDKEIMKLYEINQNDDIIPKTPNNYFTLNGYKYEFSAEEYTAFKITYGQTAYTELQKLFRTTEYKGMTTEDKEKAIEDVYDLAEQAAREEYGITPDALIKEYGEKEAANRLLKGEQVQKYEMAKKNIGLNLKQYYIAYNAQKDVEGKKDSKGDTISGTKKTNRINAMEKAGLTKSQATQLYKILEGEL